MGVSINGGTQKWMVDFMGKSQSKMNDDLGVPLFYSKPPYGKSISGNLSSRNSASADRLFFPLFMGFLLSTGLRPLKGRIRVTTSTRRRHLEGLVVLGSTALLGLVEKGEKGQQTWSNTNQKCQKNYQAMELNQKIWI